MAITLGRKDNSSGVHQVRLADGKSHKDDPLVFFNVGHFKLFIEYGSILLLFLGGEGICFVFWLRGM